MNQGENMDLSIAVLSKPGGRAYNEDACGYWSVDQACCCVVSDGLGGYLGGQVASKLVVSTVLKQFASSPGVSRAKLSDFLVNANQALLEEKRLHPELAEMRATMVVLAFDFSDGIANWAHLGDTRLYRFRQGCLQTQTLDHSYLQNMVNLGQLDRSEIRTHPMRNLLLGALGSEAEYMPSIQSQPVTVETGDAYLLCTDGFWQYLQEGEMQAMLIQASSAEDWLNNMETTLLERVQAGNDNYSAIAVWLSASASRPGQDDGENAAMRVGQFEDMTLQGNNNWAEGTLPL